MDKRAWVIIVGVLLLAAVASAVALWQTPAQTPSGPTAGAGAPVPVPASSTASAAPTGWNTFTNKRYGYSIACPPEWGCSHLPENADVIMYEGAGGDGRGIGEQLEITAVPVASGIKLSAPGDLAAFLRTFNSFSTNSYRFFLKPLATREVSGFGYPAIERDELAATVQAAPASQQAVDLATYFADGRAVYRVAVEAWLNEDNYSRQNPVADIGLYRQVVATFHVISGSDSTAQ